MFGLEKEWLEFTSYLAMGTTGNCTLEVSHDKDFSLSLPSLPLSLPPFLFPSPSLSLSTIFCNASLSLSLYSHFLHLYLSSPSLPLSPSFYILSSFALVSLSLFNLYLVFSPSLSLSFWIFILTVYLIHYQVFIITF